MVAANRPKFELVACEGERTRPIPVCIVLEEAFEPWYTLPEILASVMKGLPLFNAIEQSINIRSQEDRDDGRRSLMASQPALIAGCRDAGFNEPCIFLHCLQSHQQEEQELGVSFGVASRFEKIFVLIRFAAELKRPVTVLTAAIAVFERLLRKQNSIAVFVELCIQYLHSKQVVFHAFSRFGVVA